MQNRDGNQGGSNDSFRDVLRGLQEEIWRINSVEQSPGVLAELKKSLGECMGDFHSCLIYVVEGVDETSSVRYHDLTALGEWRIILGKEEKEGVQRIWQEGTTIFKWEGCQEREKLAERCGHRVHSMLEVVHSHGIIGLYSEDQAAFDKGDIERLEQVALVLSMLFHRLEDLENLQAKERQLRQVQRLQLVGQLTAEVAHEINNPLSVVIGECELLLDGSLDPEIQDGIRAISKAGRQVQSVSNRLLDFVRGNKAEKESINVNRLVQETLVLLRRMLQKGNIQLEVDMEGNLPWMDAHSGQVQQVVLNLVQNSRDALEGYRTQGLIRVKTHQNQGNIVLSVEDNGPGIPEKIQERIFEPFFTTKENGKGTGLGLSVCAGIAKEHGGELRVEPRILGTRMVLELPVRQRRIVSSN
jgi:signal transduction histidine kinase